MPDRFLLPPDPPGAPASPTPAEIEPLISVALCTYNGARFLSIQLESILAQTHTQIEIIAVDDASTDDTFNILKDYSRRDERLQVFRNPKNLGFRLNFENAMAKCKGKFIAPCDQDDIWLPEKLEVLHKSIGDAMLAYCDSEMIDSSGQSLGIRISDYMIMLSTDDPLPFVFQNCVSGHAMLIRRELLSSALPFPMNMYHDWWLVIVATSMDRIVYCGECLVQYRQHSGALTDMGGLRRQPSRLRPRGYKAFEYAAVTSRLVSILKLAASHQLFSRKMLELWRLRESQLLSIQLAFFLWTNYSRLFAIKKKLSYHQLLCVLRYSLGLQLLRRVKPHKYAS